MNTILQKNFVIILMKYRFGIEINSFGVAEAGFWSPGGGGGGGGGGAPCSSTASSGPATPTGSRGGDSPSAPYDEELQPHGLLHFDGPPAPLAPLDFYGAPAALG
ncbi:Protein of unknown function [Gryllus bimaculatus]|nr:Protein of unknown function [Gryllus bimaculatus]